MLPSQPKIFYGRESELSDILELFRQGTPRIAILGTGGMGKTSLAKAVLHHTEITARYSQHRFFVAGDSVANKLELASLIGAHLGLKPGKDLAHPVVQYFSTGPPTLLILDNLETCWEPTGSRKEIEEFLSLLTDVPHLGIMITMRGAERPGKVKWTRPFLQPLRPLEPAAARGMFMDITDDRHDIEEVAKVLQLTDNMPLAINLLAHMVDSEGTWDVLSRWEKERTSLISEGHDRSSNLDLSISLSLSSPRMTSLPHARDLLSLLSILPDGLSDIELLQSNLPIDHLPGCKTALLRTTLAYIDEHQKLKALVPIREYMQKVYPPEDQVLRSLFKHFQALLEIFNKFSGSLAGSPVIARISSNYSNIEILILNGLREGHPDLAQAIYCICYLNNFGMVTNRARTTLMDHIDIRPQPSDPQLEVYIITEVFHSWAYLKLPNPELLIRDAWGQLDQCDIDLKCILTLINICSL
ncbi:P-loop containing nucleoside triphosphate hydrolase protein [Mycena alexandri]|uniref:P-loop containing nucleoside triphosphate hydrolase protein n=1 Tax=Mycena alexandri TaxID=1745969 RepID=A0AAD6SCC1_9AGAR|nr:P-loop containing nucleoside triphosphate hydrolase protein [Mycena alexandri]